MDPDQTAPVRLLLQEQSYLDSQCLSMRLRIVKWMTKNVHFVIMRFKDSDLHVTDCQSMTN